ncbi:cysteine desulfurase [Anaerobacterium chartisolvens]|uniref:cysteine desulfurase n=1 Tax=Anaerobacterium chartisolvens TaxID=1297424 RepID=A0A369B5R9_9FIRM|nr:cysteine desulfurase family protein [Anaerobacterium chartisolvens]RCX16862.1 cysteine desulfurase [Anaerobacterium chartisolvens]
MQRQIYLDNSATTRPYDEVLRYMNHVAGEVYGNPSSMHFMGIEAERLVKKARDTIAGSIGAQSREVYFTSGGTESNNLAIRGYLEANPRRGNHILTTKIEHPSVLEVFKYLSDKGYETEYVDVSSEGIIDVEDLRKKINSRTALISVIYINNETGSVQPVDEIVNIRNSVNKAAALHIDAVQAYGKIKFSPARMGVDLMSLSSHKIHGPKGVGALYAGRHVKLRPLIFGGGQEALIRSGTENVPGICGFGLASEITLRNLEGNFQKAVRIKNMLKELIQSELTGYKIISPDDASPYILCVSFENIKAEVLLHHLEERNIFVSTGSACASRKDLHSHVLRAIGLEACYMDGPVRFSFSSFNEEEEIKEAVQAIKDILPKIQIHKRRGGRI